MNRSSCRFQKLVGVAAISGLALSACSVQSESVSERSAKEKEALLGNIDTPSCTAPEADFVVKTMNVGRFVASTPEFVACVSANYLPCSEDDDAWLPDLVSVTQSVNATQVKCDNSLGPTTNGSTSSGDEHDWTYADEEDISVSMSKTDAAMALLATPGDFFAPFYEAGVIWHEVMHVHGYSHGDNSDAVDAADDCGYGGSPTWFWRTNTAPYDVQRCLTGAYTNFGGLDSDQDLGSDPGSARKSIVEKYFTAAHKRLTANKRNGIFQQIMAGTYTVPQLLGDAAGNSRPTQATPLPFGTTVSDEVFDSFDRDYFSFTLVNPNRVTVTVTYPYQTFPGFYLKTNDGTLNPPLIPNGDYRINQTGATSVSTTVELPAGNYLVDVEGTGLITSSAPITVAIAQAVPPPPPTNCTGQMLCDGVVDMHCDNIGEQTVLERKDGNTWVKVAEDDTIGSKIGPSLEDDLLSTSKVSVDRTYRVCTVSFYPVVSCSPEFVVAVEHSVCIRPPPPPHVVDCSVKANWTCVTLPNNQQSCHCGAIKPKVGF